MINLALKEDVGEGDHSSLASIEKDRKASAQLIFKDNGIAAGLCIAESILKLNDPNCEIVFYKNDGDEVKVGEIGFVVNGNAQSLLKSERLLLNIMQRLSGIASITHQIASKIKDYNTKILDTRKTTPNMRTLEKWAVTLGGGYNHRKGLYDMIMLKDNHNDFAGGITASIEKTKQYLKEHNKDLKIIVEARSIKEVQEILKAGVVYRILLDNFDFETTKKAVEIIGNQCLTESSGNINENTIRDYALCGVNYISSGALTHSVHNMDLSLKAI